MSCGVAHWKQTVILVLQLHSLQKISSIQLDMHIAFGKKDLKDLGGASIFSGSSLALRKNLLIDPVGFDQPPCLAILYLPHY